jgi:hypothetical protein
MKKGGDEIKKKSSPLKLLSQSQPNFAEMILRWSPSKNVSVSAVLKYKTKSIKMKKKIDEKRAITPRWVIKFTSKLQGR